MSDYRNTDRIIRYVSFGIMTGLFFPAMSFMLTHFTGVISFTGQGFKELHNRFPLQYLLDILPVAGGIAGYYSGRLIKSKNDLIKDNMLNQKARSKSIMNYIKRLIQNDFDAEIDIDKSSSDLEQSLCDLREHLKTNIKEENKRKQEDDQRNWISEGLAKFAEVLRRPTENIEEFSFNIISNIVKYLDANQGGFFLVEENQNGSRFFDMKACYAYDRKKFAEKRIEWGEGLIGTSALEKQYIYMTDVPESYLEITSGIGSANPRFLLIVPLLVQEDVLGMIELASFKEIQLYKINFVESVAESIAITLASVKSNLKTAELLRESREQAEVLVLQEEKMRQSVEELKKTQEQAALQAEKFISFTNSVNHTLIRAEYSKEGILLYANTKFLRKLGYFSNSEVEGKHIAMFIDEKDLVWFNEIWDRLSQGGRHYEGYMKHMTKQGQDLWTMATYTCVRKDDGSVDKILFLAIDTTEHKKQSLDYEGQIEAINRLNIKAEFAPDGKFINCNDLFIDTMKFARSELKDMTVFDFIDKKDIENFNELWENITKGIPYQGQIKGFTKYEDEKWFRGTYTAVNDMYGEVAKVIYLANDITNEKLMEIESRKQTDQLKIQEEKLRLTGVELKKRLEQSKKEMDLQYKHIEKESGHYKKILEDVPVITLNLDRSGTVLFVNSAGEKFWNVKSNNIKGQHIKTLLTGDSELYDEALRSLLKPGSNITTGKMKNVKLPDGKGKWHKADILISLVELKDEVSYSAYIQLLQRPN